MSLVSQSVDTYATFRFLRLLTTPWDQTGAFKAGIIDATGKVLRQPATRDDRAVYNLFHKLVFNIKRLLNKLPFGKTTIASYITALFLIREEIGITDEVLLSILSEELSLIDISINESVNLIEAGEYKLNRTLCFPHTGDPYAIEGSRIAIDNIEPIGNIFGYSIFEAIHLDSNLKIIISHSDINIL